MIEHLCYSNHDHSTWAWFRTLDQSADTWTGWAEVQGHTPPFIVGRLPRENTSSIWTR